MRNRHYNSSDSSAINKVSVLALVTYDCYGVKSSFWEHWPKMV